METHNAKLIILFLPEVPGFPKTVNNEHVTWLTVKISTDLLVS